VVPGAGRHHQHDPGPGVEDHRVRTRADQQSTKESAEAQRYRAESLHKHGYDQRRRDIETAGVDEFGLRVRISRESRDDRAAKTVVMTKMDRIVKVVERVGVGPDF